MVNIHIEKFSWTKTFCGQTRPDTWPTVADRWAGAEMRVFTLSNLIIKDQRTDGPMDQRTDKASYDSVPPKPTFRVSKWVKIENIHE